MFIEVCNWSWLQYIIHFRTYTYSLESDTQQNGHNECIDLKHTQEEQSEVVEHLCEEVPEETVVWGQIWNKQPGPEGERDMRL